MQGGARVSWRRAVGEQPVEVLHAASCRSGLRAYQVRFFHRLPRGVRVREGASVLSSLGDLVSSVAFGPKILLQLSLVGWQHLRLGGDSVSDRLARFKYVLDASAACNFFLGATSFYIQHNEKSPLDRHSRIRALFALRSAQNIGPKGSAELFRPTTYVELNKVLSVELPPFVR